MYSVLTAYGTILQFLTIWRIFYQLSLTKTIELQKDDNHQKVKTTRKRVDFVEPDVIYFPFPHSFLFHTPDNGPLNHNL